MLLNINSFKSITLIKNFHIFSLILITTTFKLSFQAQVYDNSYYSNFYVSSGTNSLTSNLNHNKTPLTREFTHFNNQESSDDANSTFNDTDKIGALERLLGPQKKPISFVICMGTVYILILLCGIIGNLSTCFVIISNNCMHTSTNYYLFSLAVSDVLSLLSGLPPELYSIFTVAYPWAFGQTFCILRTFIFETTTIASVITILTFTFERWLHICKPMYAKKFSSGFSRTIRIICFIWVFSSLIASPYSITTRVFYEYPDYPDSKTCGILEQHKNLLKTVIQLSVLFLFILPMIMISKHCVFFLFIFYKAKSIFINILIIIKRF